MNNLRCVIPKKVRNVCRFIGISSVIVGYDMCFHKDHIKLGVLPNPRIHVCDKFKKQRK